MKGYLPCISEFQAATLIAQFDAELGLPKPGTDTYTEMRNQGGLISIVVDSDEVALTQQQIDAILTPEAARTAGYLPPIPQGLS